MTFPRISAAIVSGSILLGLPSLDASESDVRVIESEGDLPEPFCGVWQKGDYLVTDGENLALVGASSRVLGFNLLNYPDDDAMGSVISLVPAGAGLRSDIVIGMPVIERNGVRDRLGYSSVEPAPEQPSDGTTILQAEALYEGEGEQQARIQTLYHLFPEPGRIDIQSKIENTGRGEIEDLDYSLYFGANHAYSFSPYSRRDHPALRFTVYPKKGYFFGTVTPSSSGSGASAGAPGTLSPGGVYEVNHVLLVDVKGDELLKRIYGILNIEPQIVSVGFEEHDGSQMELIVEDTLSSSIFYRSFLDEPHEIDIVLPPGMYDVKANFFPAVVETKLIVEEGNLNTCTLRDPEKGRVRVAIVNSQGEYVPGKVTFIGLEPTNSPYFPPENPVENGRRWEEFKNSRYPARGGTEVELPIGAYLVTASRGLEYSVDQRTVEVLTGDRQNLVFTIDNVVDTEGFISVDTHMHTYYSDGRVSIAERIRSVIAEGVEVAVAADHNHVTDYYPTLKRLGLEDYLAAIIGNEISSPGLGHFNTYPISVDEGEKNGGAINPLSDRAAPLFETTRSRFPGAIIQVNHPRGGDVGYFNYLQLDVETAAFAKTHFDLTFDVLEVVNSNDSYSTGNRQTVEDWLHLLNRGYYKPIVGASDSHLIDRNEPGYSRTYVRYGGGTGRNLDENAVVDAIRKGYSFITNGPIVELEVDDVHLPGETFTAEGETVELRVEVQSAPWVAVDEVRLIMNGKREKVFPVDTESRPITKFLYEISLNVDEDCYVAVEVLGKKTLYPVLQQQSLDGSVGTARLPYALTNPVFIDVDGNGTFDPPLPEEIELREDTGPVVIIPRR